MGPAVLPGVLHLDSAGGRVFQGIQEWADSAGVHTQASGHTALCPAYYDQAPNHQCLSPLLVAEATCQHKKHHNLCPAQTRVSSNTTRSPYCHPSRPNILKSVLCFPSCFLLEPAPVAGEEPVPRAMLCCNSYS